MSDSESIKLAVQMLVVILGGGAIVVGSSVVFLIHRKPYVLKNRRKPKRPRNKGMKQ